MPPHASIALWLHEDPAYPEDSSPPGVGGPLTLVSDPICASGSGRGTTEWNGRSLGCAPTDAPTFCDGVGIGHYRIEAIVYDRENVRLVHGLAPADPDPPVVLARAEAP